MFNRNCILTLAALFGVGLVFTAAAPGQTTWYVDDDAPNDPGPGDPGISDPDEDGSAEHPFDAIQQAINAAVNSDEVVVADGTYTGYGNRSLDFWGKAITVRSENGPDNCVIDCEAGPDHWHWGFWFHNSETAAAIVDGLTITNAYCDPGGGIRCAGGASPTIMNCIVADNEALWYGGGIRCGGTTTIVGCLLLGNRAWSGGGGYFVDQASVSGCTFAGNTAEGAGGLMCGDSVRISDCVIWGNIAYEGAGGLSCAGGATIAGCTIAGNVVWYDGDGGGITCAQNSTISNCVVTCNSASGGGGIFCAWQSSPTIVGCPIVSNGAPWGAGIYWSSSSAAVSNCILWGNQLQQLQGSGSIGVSYCDIQGGWPAGVGNIDADPLFVDPNGPDDNPYTYEDNDYRLGSDSPCVDAADNDAVPGWVTTDLDGRLRFADRIGTPDTGNGTAPIVDMGPYEYQCTGDLNGNGHIELSDLAALLAHYGTTTGAVYADGDLDQDGDVDLTDLATLLASYGTTCE